MERDPQPPEIKEKFLAFVNRFHAEHSYERDFRVLAHKLDITVKNGDKDEYFTTADEKPYIIIDISNPRNRQKFSGLHELSHHLFEIAEEGELRAFLRSFHNRDSEISREIEEDLCNQAAAQMLISKPIFDAVRDQYGYTPQSIFEIAKRTDASLQASLRRLVFAYSIDVQAVIVDRNCKVIDSLAHGQHRGKYKIGYDFILPNDHPLSNMIKNNSKEVEELFEAHVPFKSKQSKWTSKVMVASNYSLGKTIAFFLDSYPNNNKNQLTLFDLIN